MIKAFTGDYQFLSNFYPCTITYNGLTFQNAEAAFQAQKCPERASEFCGLSPGAAKRLGRRVSLRADWEEAKDTIMYEVVSAKFKQWPHLGEKLVNTHPHYLVEGNTWGDTYWGVCQGEGENHLGKILMRVGEELISEDDE